ncbi:MAG: urease accessory protein UreD [Treponema sp.]|nr:urease accessory protein UreD [Treponema sp.]
MNPFERTDGGITVFQQTASAGILAGDTQEHSFYIEENAILELVSQSFEKIFKMEDSGKAERTINIDIEKGGTLIYSPLPCMPFAGSNFTSRTKINLQDDSSRLIYIDTLCGGRKEHGELFDYKSYRNLIEITRNSPARSDTTKPELIYRDNTVFEGSNCGLFPERKEFLKSPAMYGNYSHLGTMLLFGFNSKHGSALKPTDLFECLNLPAKLLYTAENLELQLGKPLVSVTQTAGNGIAVRLLANSAEEVQDIFNRIKKEF